MHQRKLTYGDCVSLCRVALALLFVLLFRSTPGLFLYASIAIAIVAQLTDHLDGYLTRKYASPSVEGWLFDSVSDRAFYIAAILAFNREYVLGDLLLWAFVLRELCYYAFRIAVGDFETVRPKFRRLVLIHAGIVRIGIIGGCLIPMLKLIGEPTGHEVSLLALVFWLSTIFGYYSLALLTNRF